jgi:translocation protein SEC63
VSRNWLNGTIQVLNFSQLFSQALFPHQSELLQLPYMEQSFIKYFTTGKKKANTIIEFLKLEEDDRRSRLRDLEDDKYKKMLHASNSFPQVVVAKAEYAVAGEAAIVPSSLVTLSVKFQAHFGPTEPPKLDDTLPPLDRYQEKAKQQWWNDKVKDPTPARSFLPVPKPAGWLVFLANKSIGRLICLTKTVGLKSEHVARLQFQSPPQPGRWTFQCYIKSDTFVGADKEFDLELVVEPPSVLPPVVEESIESSDDEDDDEEKAPKPKSRKKVVPKSERGEFDDSSDSEDDGCCDHDHDHGPDHDFVE